MPHLTAFICVEVKNLWLEYADIIVTTEDTESLRIEDNARWMDDDLLSDFSDVENDASTDDTRSGARKGDNQTNTNLLSSGQHNVKSRLTLVYHVWLETSLLYQQCQMSQSASPQAPAQ
jgi:hypothetical protein